MEIEIVKPYRDISFTTNFYDYQFEIEYQGDKFDQMSPGKHL